ncbi:MAG: ABC transporter ATP-binding protein [Oceanidesulfovibrio sp.]
MITVNNISKAFRLYAKPSDRLREIVFRKTLHRVHQALKDVSFQVQAGETLGIIGENGSGKSTLLKILTGVLRPDSGSFAIDGRITGLLELGTGFNAEFSGMDNIYMNGSYLGLSRQMIDERLEAIVAFTELGEFIHEPLKTYSSGMTMRLAFSVAIHADPQCFVVDEALAVGDVYFQQKCMQRLKEFRAGGGSIVFVSHDLNAIKVLCDKAVLLDKGRVAHQGEPDGAVNAFNYLIARHARGAEITYRNGDSAANGYGNHKMYISGAQLLDEQGNENDVFVSGQPATIRLRIAAEDSVDSATVGILIRDRYGQDIFGTNSFHLKVPVEGRKGRESTCTFAFDELNVGPGSYTLTAAIHAGDSHVQECYQWVDAIKSFEVVSGGDFYFTGLNRLKPTLTVQPEVS